MGFQTPGRDAQEHRRLFVRMKDALVLLSVLLAIPATIIMLLFVVVGLFGPRPTDNAPPQDTDVFSSPQVLFNRPYQPHQEQTAQETLEVGRSKAAELQKLQRTPTGHIELGNRLFERMLFAMTDHKYKLQSFSRLHGEHFGRPPAYGQALLIPNNPVWNRLAEWTSSNNIELRFVESTEFWTARTRFLQLAQLKSRTGEEEAELWKLIVTCGRDWLQIPFNKATYEFDLQAELPAGAPETIVRKINEMVQILEHDRNQRGSSTPTAPEPPAMRQP